MPSDEEMPDEEMPDEEILGKMTIEDFADELAWSPSALMDLLGWVKMKTGVGRWEHGNTKKMRWERYGDLLMGWVRIGDIVLKELPGRICEDDPGMYRVLKEVAAMMEVSAPMTRHQIHGPHKVPDFMKSS